MYSLATLQGIINEEIAKEAKRLAAINPKNLYIPIEYTLGMGGKRLRPVMVLLSYNLYSENITNAVPAAMAIEIFHNFTLLHDDIMDKADIRRSSPTVHKKFNENAAILSGDVMSFVSFQYLLKSRSEKLTDAIELFASTAVEVCEGQQYDMDFELRLDVSEKEYLNMIRLKTAVLLGCSLKLGAVLANAPENDQENLYRFGINLGMAFQLQDDLLDSFGDEEVFGKKIGGDISTNKKTYLLIKALGLANKEQSESLLKWILKKDFEAQEKIEAIINIYNSLNIKKITQQKIDFYFDAAIDNLKNIKLKDQQRTQLVHLSEIINERNK